MTLKRGSDGQLYGTAPVILSKEVDGEFVNLRGSAAPFGGIMVSEEYLGQRYTEEPHSWWENQGFIIAEAPELKLARETYWDSKRAKAQSSEAVAPVLSNA